MRGVEGGLKALAGKHEASALESACETALGYGARRLRSIRQLLKRASTNEQKQFAEFQTGQVVFVSTWDFSFVNYSWARCQSLGETF